LFVIDDSLPSAVSRSIAVGVSLFTAVGCTLTDSQPEAALPAFEIAIGADTPLEYPSGLANLPNGYTSFLPASTGASSYLVFASSTTATAADNVTGAIVLETTDLMRFTLANGFGSSSSGGLVFVPPSSYCNSADAVSGSGVFDQNYAAPGSVLQDPTLPQGNLIMVYQAGLYCYPGGSNLYPFASVGLARSANGGKTWPASGTPDRYAIVQVAGSRPSVTLGGAGDASPSAFVDDVAPGNFLYVVYQNLGAVTAAALTSNDGFLRIARAKLGQTGPLTFGKWDHGTWSQPGIGGTDSAITPQLGCRQPGYQHDGQISYVESQRLYLLTFVCATQEVGAIRGEAAWYYSTATSLESQDWSAPAPIPGTSGPVEVDTGAFSSLFNGWYPSFLSPGTAPGHLGRTGLVFYGQGGDRGLFRHAMLSRTFAIH